MQIKRLRYPSCCPAPPPPPYHTVLPHHTACPWTPPLPPPSCHLALPPWRPRWLLRCAAATSSAAMLLHRFIAPLLLQPYAPCSVRCTATSYPHTLLHVFQLYISLLLSSSNFISPYCCHPQPSYLPTAVILQVIDSILVWFIG